MYKLLAINIDGTLLQSNGRIHKATKDAIDYVKNKDVYVTLVTSRNFLSAKKIAKALKLESLLVCQHGAFIGKSLDKPIYVKRIPEEKTFNIVQVLENFDCTVRLMHERFSIGNKKRIKDNLIAKAVFQSGDPLYYPMQFVDSLGDSLRDNPVEPLKIEVYFTDHTEQQRVEQTLTEAFKDIQILNHQKGKLEILSSGVSKLAGLTRLGHYLGFSLQEMVAIGDSIDDIQMIERVGLGVAMWNAPTQVKKVSDWVTRSNNQQGVAYMVKEHFRKQQRLAFLRQVNRVD